MVIGDFGKRLLVFCICLIVMGIVLAHILLSWLLFHLSIGWQ